MAVLDFTDLAAMKTFVEGKLSSPDSDEVETLLEQSYSTYTTDCLGYTLGADGLYTVSDSQAGYEKRYRPYYALAVYPLLFPSSESYNQELYEMVKGAAGSSVKFRDPDRVHDQLMRTQAAYDRSACHVQEGFEVKFRKGLQSAKMVRL